MKSAARAWQSTVIWQAGKTNTQHMLAPNWHNRMLQHFAVLSIPSQHPYYPCPAHRPLHHHSLVVVTNWRPKHTTMSD
jgi:hypothetical protein